MNTQGVAPLLPQAGAGAGRRRGLLLSAAALLACAGAKAQVMEDVPFITTPDNVTVAMLELARVSARDVVIDLGSGDGRIVITAARRFGARGLGVEIDPALVERSRANAAKAGVADRAEFREQDLFKTDLGAASVITMYLLPAVNLQLRPALLALKPGTRLVSHDWDMGDWVPDRTLTVDAPDKAIGREKLSQLHLWVVPARVEGLWCGTGGRQLRLTQAYQFVQGRMGAERDLRATQGRVDGPGVSLQAGAGALTLRWEAATPQGASASAGRLQVKAASGPWQGWKGSVLQKATADRCPA